MYQRITRRQNGTEQDRYGGYGSQPQIYLDENSRNIEVNRNSPQISIPLDSYSEIYGSHAGRASAQGRFAEFERLPDHGGRTYAMQQPIYQPTTIVEDFDSSATTAPMNYGLVNYSKMSPIKPEVIGDIDLEVEKVQRRKVKKMPADQIMPSIARHSARTVNQENPQAQKKSLSRSKAKSQDKTMLAIYVGIVVAIAIAIIATGIAVSVSQSTSNALESQLAQQQQIILLQEAEMARLADPEYLALRAELEGMVPVGDAYTSIQLIELPTTAQTVVPSNWFDRFARFLSNMFN